MLTRKAVPLLTRPRSSLLTNLVLYYPFSNANDSHTNALNLTATNSPSFTTGKIANAASLARASSQYFSRADESLLRMTGKDFTFNCWIYLNSTASYQTPVCKGDGATTGGYEWLIYAPDNLGVAQITFSNGTTSQMVRHGTTLATSTWYMLTLRWNTTTKIGELLVNNAGSVTTSALSGTLNATVDPFFIGWDKAGTDYLNGRICEAGLWASAAGAGGYLTNAQLANLYAAQNAGTGSYPFLGIP